jgi:lycopene cyclase domain-containing protein
MPAHFTYLTLLIGWAAPVIALHWVFGAPELRARLRLLSAAVLLPTLYLSIADAAAIGSGVWSISEELTVGWRVGSLVFEEVVFFFLTNVLVAQSIVLFLSPSARDRAERGVRSLLRQRPSPPAQHEGRPAAADSPEGRGGHTGLGND